jgi:hypothetical protein
MAEDELGVRDDGGRAESSCLGLLKLSGVIIKTACVSEALVSQALAYVLYMK